MTPLLRSFLEFLMTCRAGIAVPAHTLRGWVAQRMGDPRRLPNPLGHAPTGDSQKLFFSTSVLPGSPLRNLPFLFYPRPGRVSGCGGWDKLMSPRLLEPRVSRNGSGNTQCLGGTNRGPVPSLSESPFDYWMSSFENAPSN